MIRNIIKRRNNRINSSQIVNAQRYNPYNSEIRSGTCPSTNKEERNKNDDFEMPKDALGDYEDLSDKLIPLC